MNLTSLLEKVVAISFLAIVILYFIKDNLPDPEFYRDSAIKAPVQTKSGKPKSCNPQNQNHISLHIPTF